MNISHINPNPLLLTAENAQPSRIGLLLLQQGKITQEDAERIFQLQQKSRLRFGEAARKLGLVNEADIQHALGIQFGYSYMAPGENAFSKALAAAYKPFTPQVEALRALRSQLMIHWFERGNKALAVVAANAREGCSDLAANLAVVFSQLGERTLLIDANLRHPSQRAIFNLDQQRGLSDILIGRAGLEAVIEIESLPGLSVLGAGTVPPNPQELLSRKVFTDFIARAKDQFDIVIVDTPPATVTSDAQTIAARCGGALLVSRVNETRMSDLTNVRDQLTMSDVQIVAAIVNDF
jgi:chain length determinant protein tyrosine kinase EpsG